MVNITDTLVGIFACVNQKSKLHEASVVKLFDYMSYLFQVYNSLDANTSVISEFLLYACLRV